VIQNQWKAELKELEQVGTGRRLRKKKKASLMVRGNYVYIGGHAATDSIGQLKFLCTLAPVSFNNFVDGRLRKEIEGR
jgi:hypothetical protein